MNQRRLILPPQLRGPLRVSFDEAVRSGVTHPTGRVRQAALLLAWVAFCIALYVMGNHPYRAVSAPAAGAAIAKPAPAAPATAHPATVHPAIVAQHNAAPTGLHPSPRSPLSPEQTRGSTGPVKPLQDRNNLAVFGDGVPRQSAQSTLDIEDGWTPADSQEPAALAGE